MGTGSPQGMSGATADRGQQLALRLRMESPPTPVKAAVERRRGTPPILLALKKETGQGMSALKRAQKHHPGDVLKQVYAFFEDFTIPAATGRKRTVGIKTEQLYIVQMRVMVGDLRKLNMGLQNLGEISPRHVRALIQHYEAQGLSSSSLQKKTTVLRRFGIWIGRPDIAPRLSDLVVDPSRASRSYSATVSKAWTSKGVSTQRVIDQMRELCPVAGLQLEIQLEFGLRPREVVMLKPVSADQGKTLFVTDGTKGGRARMVPVDNERKRELIERAKVIAAANKRGVLSDRPTRSLTSALNRYYYLAKKVGLCKSDLGVTLHGLRHEFANNLYRQLTGVNSPVNGGRVKDQDLAGEAMQTVSEQLGHSRKHASAAYLGSARHVDFAAYNALKKLVTDLESNQALRHAVAAVGPSTWWLVGESAEGSCSRGVLNMAFEINGDVSADAEAVLHVANIAGQVAGAVPRLATRRQLQSRETSWLELIELGKASEAGPPANTNLEVEKQLPSTRQLQSGEQK